jgi:hypothetical protein
MRIEIGSVASLGIDVQAIWLTQRRLGKAKTKSLVGTKSVVSIKKDLRIKPGNSTPRYFRDQVKLE